MEIDQTINFAKNINMREECDLRELINGIVWVLRIGLPWCDLPEKYGS